MANAEGNADYRIHQFTPYIRTLNFREKIIELETLRAWRESLRATGKRLVVTNGCFDLLHVGHVTCLEAARTLGDALLVGVNDDQSVRALKGEGRPLNAAADRATLLAALEVVDAVCVFHGLRATAFLEAAQPDVWTKGGDNTLATLPSEERLVIERCGGRVILTPFVPEKSTSNLVQQIKAR